MSELMQIPMSAYAGRIIEVLERAGYEAYIVGGCVRDALLGREPQDWDITTSALPLQVKEQFRRTIDTGIQHGTVTVMMEKEGFEVTTYRIDGDYTDGRHPNRVEFVSNLSEDLRRRDFTINAMAYNPRTGVVDLFGGKEDLAAGIIRCVGEARERFSEDALRMMRALRFAAQLDFLVEEDTRRAICEMSDTLAKVSRERVQTELLKLIVSRHPEYVRSLYETGVYRFCYPGYEKLAGTQTEREILTVLPKLPADKALRLAELLREEEKPEKILKDLKFDNDTMNRVAKVVRFRRESLAEGALIPDEIRIRQAMNRMGVERFFDVLAVLICEAENGCETGSFFAAGNVCEIGSLPSVETLLSVKETAEQILKRGDAIVTGDLAVTGRDLIAAGITPGPKLGETLAALLARVLVDPAENEKEHLLSILHEL